MRPGIRPSSSLGYRHSLANEICVDSGEQRVPIQARLRIQVTRLPTDLVHQVSRMAGPQRFVQLSPDDIYQLVDDTGFTLKSARAANRMEDGMKLLFRNRTNFDLGLNSAHEGLVG